MARTILKPAFPYPHRYEDSVPEIFLTCACHRGYSGGSARRTGLTGSSAVYRLAPTNHQELRDELAVLTEGGLILLGRKAKSPAELLAEMRPPPAREGGEGKDQ